jgi:hypothetical protein
MSHDMLGIYIRQHIEASTEPVITFTWHGENRCGPVEFLQKRLPCKKNTTFPAKRSSMASRPMERYSMKNMPVFFRGAICCGDQHDSPEACMMCTVLPDGKPTFRKVLHGTIFLWCMDRPGILCVNVHNVKYPSKYTGISGSWGSVHNIHPLVEKMGIPVRSSNVSAGEDFGIFLAQSLTVDKT